MKLQYSQQSFQKYSNTNFIEIRSVGAELFHADRRTSGQRDRHDEANSRFSQFRESA